MPTLPSFMSHLSEKWKVKLFTQTTTFFFKRKFTQSRCKGVARFYDIILNILGYMTAVEMAGMSPDN